jgi:Ca2+-binding RTX toxin-like protein
VRSRPAGHPISLPIRRIAAVAALLVLGLVAPPAAFAAAPANDDFAAAKLLGSRAAGTARALTLEATKQLGEPAHAGDAGGHSVWFSWTAPADGNESFSTAASDFDTLLAVYTGPAVDALTAVASNDDLGSFQQSTVSFRVSSGVTYLIAVDGFAGKKGRVGLRWAPAPANDNFVDAQPLPGTGAGTATGSTRGSTREPGEPESEVDVGRIWFSWTAPSSGTYKFDTVGSTVDTVLGVYEGASLESLSGVGINDDDPDRGCCFSWVPIIDTTAGTRYSIFVAPLSDESDDGPHRGSVQLNWGPLVLGSDGPDRLVGTPSSEELRGGPGNDLLRGRGGDDVVFGGGGSDRLYGGTGKDSLVDHRGSNRLFGNRGADNLDARGGGVNLLNGGPGTDRCRGGRGDIRRRCP